MRLRKSEKFTKVRVEDFAGLYTDKTMPSFCDVDIYDSDAADVRVLRNPNFVQLDVWNNRNRSHRIIMLHVNPGLVSVLRLSHIDSQSRILTVDWHWWNLSRRLGRVRRNMARLDHVLELSSGVFELVRAAAWMVSMFAHTVEGLRISQ